ncbi:MAG TPA: universal stress protein [Methanosarcina sp.]|nr:universal stress protein [Methanosarcina sp.]
MLFEKYKDVDKAIPCLIGQNKFKKVLLPLDFSVHSGKVLGQLIDISNLIEEVVLLSVVEGAYNDEALLKATQEKEQKLESVKDDLLKLGLKVKTMVCQGSASTNIVEVAEQEEARLIAMATRGESLIKDLLLGSTSHSVARRSKRPLLLIPSPQV